MFAAGFYYKTFMWPAKFWESLYEPMIRRAAGLGVLSTNPDPSHYDKGFLHCDVLIVGGGAAGLAAAQIAGQKGQRVILCDEQPSLGGRLQDEQDQQWLEKAQDALAGYSNVRVMTRTTVFGTFDHGVYGAVTRNTDHLALPDRDAPKQTLWKITAGRCVLATGALERPIAFPTTTGQGSCWRARFKPMRFVTVSKWASELLFINHEQGLACARALQAAGVNLVAVVDARDTPKATDLPHFVGAQVTNTKGRHALKAIQITGSDGQGQWIAVMHWCVWRLSPNVS